jgi:hypothetical protein
LVHAGSCSFLGRFRPVFDEDNFTEGSVVMVASNHRSQRRIPKEQAVDLVCTGAIQFKETALAQNVSAGGARVATERIWRPGERVLLSPHEGGKPVNARVVYCQRLENGNFAIGLEVLAAEKGEPKLQ